MPLAVPNPGQLLCILLKYLIGFSLSLSLSLCLSVSLCGVACGSATSASLCVDFRNYMRTHMQPPMILPRPQSAATPSAARLVCRLYNFLLTRPGRVLVIWPARSSQRSSIRLITHTPVLLHLSLSLPQLASLPRCRRCL